MAVRSNDDFYQSPSPEDMLRAWKPPTPPSFDDISPKYPWWMAPLPVFPSQPPVRSQPSGPSPSQGPTSYPSWMIPFVPPTLPSQPPAAPQPFAPSPSQGPGSSADSCNRRSVGSERRRFTCETLQGNAAQQCAIKRRRRCESTRWIAAGVPAPTSRSAAHTEIGRKKGWINPRGLACD